MRFWQALDPRARVLSILAATILISSTAPGHVLPFAFYFPLVLAMILLCSKVSWSYIITRCIASSPFILLASVLLLFQYDLTPEGRPAGIGPAASVAGKGYAAALLLSFLTASTGLSQLLWSLRKLGSPESLNLILSMMYRYTSLLSEEWSRMERARDSRSVRPLAGKQLYSIYGRQMGNLLVRSWDRAERVNAAMLSRGFHGSWPVWEAPHFGLRDALFVLVVIAAFAAVRVYV
jgi:cobalt/nickel transport system permease protein